MADMAAQLLNLLRESFSTTLEATAKAQEQTWRFIDELTRRGVVVQEEGKKLVEDWTKTAKANFEELQKRVQEDYKRWEEALQKGLATIIPASKKDLDDLSRKVEELAKRVEALTQR